MKQQLLKVFCTLLVIVSFWSCQEEKISKPKYVFYFIGDGMGVNQVNGTEMFLAEIEGRIGTKPLNFATFPVRNYISTFSELNSVTCSSAAGTALASGKKTKNNVLGMDKDAQNPIYSIAVKAKEAGKKVGVTTTVGINHATPGAFYAHQPNRNNYFEIGVDAIKADFDLYGGGGIIRPFSKDSTQNLFSMMEEAGYRVAFGNQASKNAIKDDNVTRLLIVEEGPSSTLSYMIDQDENNLTLAQITESSIEFLHKNNSEFFLMVEGGMIDYACHANDAATAFYETVDFALAIEKAIDFYNKYPNETLIVVTADHETGGMALGNGPYQLNLKLLQNQKVSLKGLTEKINGLRKSKNNKVSWQEIQFILKENLGFWDAVQLSDVEEKQLRDSYNKSFSGNEVEMAKNLYSSDEPIAKLAVNILNRKANISWASGGHSAGVVPVYAIGVGAEKFSGHLDNIDIPIIISEIAGY